MIEKRKIEDYPIWVEKFGWIFLDCTDFVPLSHSLSNMPREIAFNHLFSVKCHFSWCFTLILNSFQTYHILEIVIEMYNI